MTVRELRELLQRLEGESLGDLPVEVGYDWVGGWPADHAFIHDANSWSTKQKALLLANWSFSPGEEPWCRVLVYEDRVVA